MITASDLQIRLRRQPFVPLRIVTSSGKSYEIRHPEFATVSRHYIHIGEASPEEPTVPDKIDWVSILHIAAVEDLPQNNSSGTSNTLNA